MTWKLAALAGTLVAAVACGAAGPRAVVGASERPPAAVAAAPRAAATPAPSVLFDDAGVEEIFADPQRVAKLRTAFPAIDAAVARTQRDLKLPGLAVAIIVDGEVAHVSAAGYRDIAKQAPVTADTVFRIGSVTKTLTAAAIVKLRDEGKLSLDDAAAKHLPELRGVRYPTTDSPPITVRHLLSHTSGLPRSPWRSDERIAQNQPLTREELGTALQDASLAFAPGSGALYSNLGFTLLGLIVERVAKMPYRTYLAKSFFEPLAMKSPGWERARLPAAHVALPYESKDGALTLVTEEEQLGRADASGGLYLSVKDLARWVGFNLSAYPARSGADGGPLARASLREMHGANGTLQVSAGRPFSAPDSWVAEPWAASSALGWDATALCDFARLLEKGGFVERYQTSVGFFPNEGVGLVVLTNTGHVDALKRRAFFDVLKLLQQSGGLAGRVRVARRAPALDAALARLLAVMDAWDEEKYLAMLTSQHKRNVPTAVEKAELAGYAALHGRCGKAELVRFDTKERGRYRLECERGKLEMDLTLANGLIDGFVGTSTDVSADAVTIALADAELAKRSKDERHRKEYGRCKLGALRDRDGNRWFRFALTCERGPVSILALRLSAKSASEVEAVEIEPVSGGACAVLARAAERSGGAAGRGTR